MASFADALSNHRTALFEYMAKWSLQQESLVARYADGECREEPAVMHEHLKGAGLNKRFECLEQFQASEGSQVSAWSPRGKMCESLDREIERCTPDGFHGVVMEPPAEQKTFLQSSASGSLSQGSSLESPVGKKGGLQSAPSCSFSQDTLSEPPAPQKAVLPSSQDTSSEPPAGQKTVVHNAPTGLLPQGSRTECGIVPTRAATEEFGPTRGRRRSSWTSLETEGIKRGIAFVRRRGHMKRMRPGLIADMVESSAFKFTFAAIIMANAIFMAITTDHTLESTRKGFEQNRLLLLSGDIFFTVCYVIEVAFKVSAYGIGFFLGHEWQWNLFDLLIVLSALVDLIAPIFMGNAVNITYLRISRIARLIKMMRVFKVYRMFKELRLIVASIMGCVKTMFWAISLITIVLFTVSLLFVQGVTDYLQSHSASESNEELMLYWGSTGTALISLFQSSTGGRDWSVVAEPLWKLGWVYYFAFMIYICFFMFVVVNVLTGLFVDAALHASTKDDAMMILEEMNNKQAYVQQIQTLFRRLNDNQSGELTWKMFEKGMHSADMLAFASALDIEISDINEFFRLISADGREVVDIEKFVVGCMKLKGAAKSLDVVSLLHRTKMLEHNIKKFISRTDRRLEEQQALVNRALQERRQEASTAQERKTEDPVVGCAASAAPSTSVPSNATCEDTVMSV